MVLFTIYINLPVWSLNIIQNGKQARALTVSTLGFIIDLDRGDKQN